MSSILAPLEACVATAPAAPAVVSGATTLSYRELWDRSYAVATQLRARGVGPETIVALYAERSIEAVVGLVGILRAGAAFVTIDPIDPPARSRQLVRALQPVLIATTSALADVLEGDRVLLDRPLDPAAVALPQVTGRMLAYGIFTSGSTGEPKLVGIEHASLASYVRGVSERLELPPGARYAIVSTLAADLGYTMVFPAFALGGALHVITREVATDPVRLGAYMTRERIDCLKIVPSHLSALVAASREPAALLPAQRLVLGGEASSARWAQELAAMRPGLRVFNHYGPTETTVGVITRELDPSWRGDVDRVPLGLALPGVRARVLDERADAEVERGELYLGGAQIARGYLGRPGLTAARFVPDPSGPPGARAYRTGDLVRVLEGGVLDFLGRIDDQVKIRGYRIEPGEIQSAIRALLGVADAAVVAVDEPGQERKLVAYVVPRTRPKATGKARYVLPNGLDIVHLHRHETDYIYREVFELQAYLRRGIRLRDGARILDVGANIGLFSLFATEICAAPQILAFEPNPAVFELLEANLAAYAPGSRALRCGLAARDGDATFTFFKGYSLLSGLHTDMAVEQQVVASYVRNQAASANDRDLGKLADSAEALIAPRFEAEKFTVQLRTLSEVMRSERIDHVDLLKINVEKAEVDVLGGLADPDWRRIDQIVAEIDLEHNVEPIKRMLEAHDFDYVIDQDPLLANTELRYVYAMRRGSGCTLIRDEAPDAHRVAVPVHAPVTEDAVVAACRERLPAQMIPSAVMLLEQLPLTPNGKLDRKALPPPPSRAQPTSEFATETMRQLAALWAELLATTAFADDDSFFDIGGTSLLAIRLAARILDTFGVELALARLFVCSTIAEMAGAIYELRSA
ncbi:MAG: amino acid adenylation domain [Myxococcales bacterium]|nr:amino acid adenylation domain [Myxococcales bacterium]